MSGFEGKIAIVTGGASGIGRSLCEEMARRGSRVVVADINAAAAKQVAAGISAAGGRAAAAALDVSREEQVLKLVDDTVAAHGRLDYMVNNAGIGILGEMRDLTLEHWRRSMDVNLWGVIYGCHAAYRIMVDQGSGHIVNVASLAGLIPAPGAGPYGTSKHAVVGLSTSLRIEGAALGVKVSTVCPGVIKTPIFETAELINTDKDDFMGAAPDWIAIGPDQAARIILRGVARNQSIILPPFRTRLPWWLTRLHPDLMDPLWRMFIKTARKYRSRT